MPKRVFVSFDYDYDKALKKARARIRRSDLVIVICGDHTDKAVGVGIELKIAQEEQIEYFLLNGYSGSTGKKPTTAKSTDEIYKWTRGILKQLVGGAR